jgi:hypothetical protein
VEGKRASNAATSHPTFCEWRDFSQMASGFTAAHTPLLCELTRSDRRNRRIGREIEMPRRQEFWATDTCNPWKKLVTPFCMSRGRSSRTTVTLKGEVFFSLLPLVTMKRACQSHATTDLMTLQLKPGASAACPAPQTHLPGAVCTIPLVPVFRTISG